jgi:hypothetical protein
MGGTERLERGLMIGTRRWSLSPITASDPTKGRDSWLGKRNEIVAQKIIALAKAGERDPERLCDDVLKEFRAPPQV